MKEYNDIDEILDFAIENEQRAVDFYNELALRTKNDDMKQTFEKFALEEIGHKAKLMKVKEDKIFETQTHKIIDLKISDYLDHVKATDSMTYQEALILAMKREKSAFILYSKLAERTTNKGLQNLFNQLAQEESKHKLMFEIEYDEVILREN
jgi:rubrerythrin